MLSRCFGRGLFRHALGGLLHDDAFRRFFRNGSSGVRVGGGGKDVGLFRGLGGVAHSALTAQHDRDHLFGLADGGFIRLHDIELLTLGGIALGAGAGGAGDGVTLDVPVGKIAQLHAHQRTDLILREVGDETVRSGVHDLGKAHEQGRGLDLVQHGVDDLHLVDAALDIAGGKGVALPGKGQGGLTVQMVPAFGKGGGVVVAGAAH